MTDIYCGNNSLSKELTSKKKRRGSRFECFQKGVGIGLAQSLDKSYLSKYKAIDKRKMYCGKARGLPDGYSIMGSSSMCLQHGVGVGKKLKAKRSKSRRKSKVKSRKKSKVKSRRKSKVKSRKKSRRKSRRKSKVKSRKKSKVKSRKKSKVKSRKKSKVKSRKKSKVKSRRKSKVKSRKKSKVKSRRKSRRKSKVKYRKMSNMRSPRNRNILPPNNFCFDDRMNDLTRYLGNKYVISCLHDERDNLVQKTIIIKSRYNVMIAEIKGLFVNEDQESFINWLNVNPRYRGRMFGQYLMLLFAKLSSIYGKTHITLEDDTDNAIGFRENRTSRDQPEDSIRPQGYPLRDLGNIYLKMGFRYKHDDTNEMIVDVNHILEHQRRILSKFMEKN
jgi:ribosomal protein S18 acetylase RimI-like enzyme